MIKTNPVIFTTTIFWTNLVQLRSNSGYDWENSALLKTNIVILSSNLSKSLKFSVFYIVFLGPCIFKVN